LSKAEVHLAMLEVGKIRERLLAERRALVAKVAEVDDNLRWLEANAGEYEAQVQAENIVRALGARLDDKGKAQLDAIGRALVRIASGEYGRCTSCGSDIPHEHLEESPTMENCPPCAEGRGPYRQ
jgi:DnaK suppressor protein